jgi:hypothetical protein
MVSEFQEFRQVNPLSRERWVVKEHIKFQGWHK